jgi:2-amino-4-hydroxy-6-hydroxymethyldihydropteridine diphosphokinase
MNTAIIGLGSNIAPEKNIALAKYLLSQQFHLLAKSKIRRTRPVGMPRAKGFLNGAILIETVLSCSALRQELKNIEQQLGRPLSHRKNASRTIDLDILVFNHKIIDPDVWHRAFLRKSIMELDSNLFEKKNHHKSRF